MGGYGYGFGAWRRRAGGGGAWSMASVLGSDGVWLRAGDITGYADGAGITTPWPDAGNGGNDATPAGSPLYVASSINGLPGVQITNAGRKFTSPPILGTQANTGFTMYGAVKRLSSGLRVWASHNGIRMYAGATDGLGYFNLEVPSPVQQTVGIQSLGTSFGIGSYQHFVMYDGAKCKMGLFGPAGYVVDTTSKTGNIGLSGSLIIGDLSIGGYQWSGEIAEVAMAQKAIADDDHFNIVDYLCTQYGFTSGIYTTRKKMVIFDGNSLTTSYNATAGNTYPERALALLGSTYAGRNVALGGANTAVQAAKARYNIDSHYSTVRAANIAVLWEITNDLKTNLNAADAITRYVAWCQGRRALGFKVVALTVLPRKLSDVYAAFEADRQTCNAYLRANWASFADALADVAADTRIGDAGDELNPMYYSDGVHLNNAGYAIIADYVVPAVQSLT